tara:strand:+ start:322 stop:555 length:234 start_codon:yes stop_codon:yes gene_type:complete
MEYKGLKRDEAIAKCIELDALLVESNEKLATLQAEKDEAVKPVKKVKPITQANRQTIAINEATKKKRLAREKALKKK